MAIQEQRLGGRTVPVVPLEARQEIEDAIAQADYRELSQEEQTYLDYGDF
jgi:hypothetical protein